MKEEIIEFYTIKLKLINIWDKIHHRVIFLIVPLVFIPVIIALVSGEFMGHDVFYWILALHLIPVFPVILGFLLLYKKVGSIEDTQFIIVGNIGSLIIAVNTVVLLIIHAIHGNYVPPPVVVIPLTILIIIVLGTTTRIMKTGLRHQSDITILTEKIKKGNLDARIDNPLFLQDSMFGEYGILINELLEPIARLAQEKKQFIRTLSHELRTPISVINMSNDNIENFRTKMSDEELNSLTKAIAESTKIMVNLLETLQTFLNIEEYSKQQLVKCSPSLMIQEVIEKIERKYTHKQIEIIKEIDDYIQLVGDKRQISTVIYNILDNAIRYSKGDTGIKIGLFNKYSGKYNPKNEDGVLFQFNDKGFGIHPDNIQHIFDPFFRADDATTLSGAGLGLFIAKKIVTNHNGEIYVESEYGSGSVFSVFLPKQITINSNDNNLTNLIN